MSQWSDWKLWTPYIVPRIWELFWLRNLAQIIAIYNSCSHFHFAFSVLCFKNIRRSHTEVFYIKGVLRNFAKFTGKHPCSSLLILTEHLRWLLLKHFILFPVCFNYLLRTFYQCSCEISHTFRYLTQTF